MQLLTSVFLNVYFTTVVSYLDREIGNNNRALLPWLFLQKQKYNKLCCPVEGVKASPLQVRFSWVRWGAVNELGVKLISWS